MVNILRETELNGYLIWGAKIIFSLCVMGFIFRCLFIDGVNPYYSYKDYNYQNNIEENTYNSLSQETKVSQTFIAKGDMLNNISIYLVDSPNQDVDIAIVDSFGKKVKSMTINLSSFISGEWNQVALNCKKLKINEQYTIVFSSEENLESLLVSYVDAPIVFGGCTSEKEELGGNLVLGFQFTYRYMTLGSFFELLLKIVFSCLMGIGLCYTICRIETIYQSFVQAEKKIGIWYAIYFAVSLVLIYNPLDRIRNEVTEFARVIGIGIVENVDVSKRVNNFNMWFIIFAITFILFYLLVNHLLHKQFGEENKKVILFLDNFMVLANCSLLLRCITYFYDESISDSVYYFSSYAVMLVVFVAIAYIVFRLENNISANEFAKLVLIGVSVSYPLAIFVALEWGEGRVLLGVMFICQVLILSLCKFTPNIIMSKYYAYILTGGVLILCMLPAMTSVYIELIHVLNQYSLFVARPAKYYKIAVLLMVLICLVYILLLIKNKWTVTDWKKWVYPWLIFGMACLSVQIPIQSTYNLDMFESANYGILISDFFDYGSIPIVEHYGGHMLANVWEGILYGLVNNDYIGAVVSPYSSLFLIVLVVLFFYLIKNAWNEDMALFVTLFFPFYSFWNYYGLGMLICLAAMAYVRKNSYSHAVLLWLSFIWCALYRLDLGFAYGMAVIVSLSIYIIVSKNWKAIKELGVTLLGWGLIGFGAWVVICIRKGIDPINRLLEFLLLTLSNQNWAQPGIGNIGNTVFVWSYCIIPFMVVICLLYVVFSKKIRESIGDEKWILLLVLGFSYVGNFSRGLVRHSLVEGVTYIVMWCAYLFLALSLSVFKSNKKLILPVFMALMLFDTLFFQESNFTATCIVDGTASTPGTIVESWIPGRFDNEDQMTYWEELSYNQQVVDRVQLNENLQLMIDSYETIINTLLKDDETFVDFINKTMIYSIIGRENPAYISQSPMQLSGEFTQRQFLDEIQGSPIVLMPIDADDSYSFALDRVANAYRYYKVVEYVYHNYVPLCKCGDIYAIWCLPEKYDEYQSKLKYVTMEFDYLSELINCDNINIEGMNLLKNPDGTIRVVSIDTDSKITELQNLIDLSSYIGQKIKIRLEYTTEIEEGNIQFFYTTERDEEYSEEKAITVGISNSGIADFVIPITEYSRLRLDIPENSEIEISSFGIQALCEFIDYGYDGPIEKIDVDRNIKYDYISVLHNYDLEHLPRIWAERDEKNAMSNAVITELQYMDGFYAFESENVNLGENGNYLKINAVYDGTDLNGLYDDDDEFLDVTIVLGDCQNGKFIEKCRYTLKIQEGTHDYLLRVSADYYWYLGEINAVKIQTDGVHNVDMQILEGD